MYLLLCFHYQPCCLPFRHAPKLALAYKFFASIPDQADIRFIGCSDTSELLCKLRVCYPRLGPCWHGIGSRVKGCRETKYRIPVGEAYRHPKLQLCTKESLSVENAGQLLSHKPTVDIV